MTNKDTIEIKYLAAEFAIEELNAGQWSYSEGIKLDKYWSGQTAPKGRHTEAQLLWSMGFLYVRFIAGQAEPLNLNKNPRLNSKTPDLWKRDVCEIFIASNPAETFKYFEFEIAPTGEWLDLEICQEPNRRETNRKYESGMKTSARIETDRVLMAIKIPWSAFENSPREGDIWKGNVFRLVGKGENRGYLAWRPTETEIPNFHVPEKFGNFQFVKE